MIFPDLVLGSASAKRISFRFRHWPDFFSDMLPHFPRAGLHRSRLHLSLSQTPLTPALSNHPAGLRRLLQATFWWLTRALSTSAVPMRWPATFSTSSMRRRSKNSRLCPVAAVTGEITAFTSLQYTSCNVADRPQSRNIPAMVCAKPIFHLNCAAQISLVIDDFRHDPKNGSVADPGFVGVAPGTDRNENSARLGLPPGATIGQRFPPIVSLYKSTLPD